MLPVHQPPTTSTNVKARLMKKAVRSATALAAEHVAVGVLVVVMMPGCACACSCWGMGRKVFLPHHHPPRLLRQLLLGLAEAA
jgi:hypothetical protein